MQLAWAPVPTTGTFSVSADGDTHGPYGVEGKEKMGNGVGASPGLAAHVLPDAMLPSRSLVVRDLFPNETVEFPFGDLPPEARMSLRPCLGGAWLSPRK
jgi:hypothetical protein